LPTNILAFDINQGCSGYVIGLSQAYGIISTGMARRGLLVTCDAYSRVISQNDKDTFGLFGDAATASLIERCPRGEGLVAFRFGSDGSGSEHLIVRRGGAAFPLEVEGTRDNFLFMNGRAIYNFVTQNLPPDIQVFLSSNGLRIEEVDQWIFHQANLFMNTKLCAMLGIPQEKAPFDIRDTGNTVSSSIPLILKKFNILGPTAEERLIVLCGFGVGLSWASCLYKHKSQS
jgi:3-oxoacyl-[acyl-carrier-protein] synthase-3